MTARRQALRRIILYAVQRDLKRNRGERFLSSQAAHSIACRAIP